MKYVVALTGGIASGKSTVAKIFSLFHIPLIDADIIARKIVSKDSFTLLNIKEYFGPQILYIDGSLNRNVLKNRIFYNTSEKDWLNNLLHPLIQYQTNLRLQSIHTSYVLWIVPLLFENNLQHFANRVLTVDIDPDIQIKRIQNRDNISIQQAKNILAAQVSRQYRLYNTDDIIENKDSYINLRSQVVHLHKKYLTFSASIIK